MYIHIYIYREREIRVQSTRNFVVVLFNVAALVMFVVQKVFGNPPNPPGTRRKPQKPGGAQRRYREQRFGLHYPTLFPSNDAEI